MPETFPHHGAVDAYASPLIHSTEWQVWAIQERICPSSLSFSSRPVLTSVIDESRVADHRAARGMPRSFPRAALPPHHTATEAVRTASDALLSALQENHRADLNCPRAAHGFSAL
jgi:hypothetical protein